MVDVRRISSRLRLSLLLANDVLVFTRGMKNDMLVLTRGMKNDALVLTRGINSELFVLTRGAMKRELLVPTLCRAEEVGDVGHVADDVWLLLTSGRASVCGHDVIPTLCAAVGFDFLALVSEDELRDLLTCSEPGEQWLGVGESLLLNLCAAVTGGGFREKLLLLTRGGPCVVFPASATGVTLLRPDDGVVVVSTRGLDVTDGT